MKRFHWLMMVCCIVPLLLIFLLPFVFKGNGSQYLPYVLMLICPLMMLLGHGDHKSDNSEKTEQPKKGCH